MATSTVEQLLQSNDTERCIEFIGHWMIRLECDKSFFYQRSYGPKKKPIILHTIVLNHHINMSDLQYSDMFHNEIITVIICISLSLNIT